MVRNEEAKLFASLLPRAAVDRRIIFRPQFDPPANHCSGRRDIGESPRGGWGGRRVHRGAPECQHRGGCRFDRTRSGPRENIGGPQT